LTSTLTAIRLTGAAELMLSQAPTTLFAPDDEAMSSLPPDTLSSSGYYLDALVKYHVVPGGPAARPHRCQRLALSCARPPVPPPTPPAHPDRLRPLPQAPTRARACSRASPPA
jgi:hypothetical protein